MLPLSSPFSSLLYPPLSPLLPFPSSPLTLSSVCYLVSYFLPLHLGETLAPPLLLLTLIALLCSALSGAFLSLLQPNFPLLSFYLSSLFSHLILSIYLFCLL